MPSTMCAVPYSGLRPDGPNTRSGLCHRPAQPPNMYSHGNAPKWSTCRCVMKILSSWLSASPAEM